MRLQGTETFEYSSTPKSLPIAITNCPNLQCCTVMRPKTRLVEDPSNLAAVSVILSASEKPIENKLQQSALFDRSKSKEFLDGNWRLASTCGTTVLEAEIKPGEISVSPFFSKTSTVSSTASWHWLDLGCFHYCVQH